MNILELDSYRLSDAVKFNKQLNPRLWDADEKLRSEVREQLLRIADDFAQSLGVTELELKDVTISGSNAAYTYTPHSDIDLHLVVDLPEADRSDVYRELFDAKKYQYNDQHNITIGGYDVELYVQDARQPHISQGIYSVLNDEWVQVPKRAKPTVDDISTRSKYETVSQHIEQAIDSGDYDNMVTVIDKIKRMRQAGLEQHGEFGPENLAFKMLRTQGLIKKLYDARNAAKDQQLSLDERRKKGKNKNKKTWGYFGGYWYPGTGYAGQDTPAAQAADGGGDGGGAESIREDAGETDEQILKDFVEFVVAELKLKDMPNIRLRRDPEWPKRHKTFGRYNDDAQTLEVAWGNRHIMDVLRTVAHELTHKRQHEREDVPASAGETGSEYENEANARAGILMRDWARLHPEHFDAGQVQGLEEAASGYIPTKKQAKDPRFSMALTVDIKPGQVGKEANKLKLKTDRQGHPQIARANGLFENLYKEYKKFKADEDYSPDEPPGPEFKPTMPAGTLRVDVSDMYDWYKMGQHISNMKGLGRHDFGAGPPSSIISFGDEDTEHKFIGDIEATGLDVTDIDPADPKKRPGKAIKTDPTYNVNEDEDSYPKVLYHGSTQEIEGPLTPRQAHDIGGAAGSNKNAIYATDDPNFAIAYSLAERGSDTGTLGWKKDPRLIFFGGKIRHGQNVYLHVLPTRDAQGRPLFTRGDADAEWYSVPGVEEIMPIKVIAKPVDQYLHLLRKPTPEEQKIFQANKARNQEAIKEDEGFDQEAGIGIDGKSFKFKIRDLVALADKYPVTKINPNQFADQISGREEDSTQSMARAQKADLKYPIIVVKRQNGQLWIADGTHRAHKAILNQLPSIGAKIIPIKDMAQFEVENLKEDEDLDEVKMSPSALEKFATSDAAKGIRAGFEAELIFRDTQGESDEMDPEPDYDADERAYSISQVIEFFSQDEYGYGLSDRQQDRLMEQLDEVYMEWRDKQMMQDFRNEAEDLVREIYLDETPMSERIIKVLTDGMEIDDAQADRILAIGMDAPRFTKSSEQEAYAEQNPDYRIYLEAADDAEAILEEEVETSIERQDGYYDQAIDNYSDNYSGDDDSFFSDVGLRWMSDIANEFNLDWPVWNMDSRGNDGSRDWEEIGNSLQDVIDMPVKVSSGYHSTTRREGQWIIEPDGSLDPDDKSEEVGLEIVSPPMPLLTAIEKLKQVVDWANDPNGGNAYTNSSTGLHMGVSLPSMKSEAVPDDIGIDYVKLILFLGDKYVLQQFGREANTYTASALDKLRQNIKGGRSDPAGVVKLLKHGLTELAQRELQKGVGTSKYTSAHIQPGYIEFRSPGGDWLAKADEEIGVLENTMMRFARAMQIAGDPSAERQEYAKKLYKLVTADNEQYADQLRLFSEFSAGTINKEQLKKQWAEKTIGKEKEINQRWKLYQSVNGTWTPVPGAEWNNYTEDQVKNAVWSKYGREALDSGEYKLVNMGEQEWEVYDVKTGKTLEIVKGKNKGEVADAVYDKYVDQGIGFNVRPYEDPAKLTPRAKLAKRITTKKIDYNYDIIDRRTAELKVVDRFYATDDKDASETFDRWLKSKGLPSDEDAYGYRKGRQAADNQKDSVDLQRRLGVQDVDTDVAQNFNQPQQDQITYEIYRRNAGNPSALHRFQAATHPEAMAELERFRQSHPDTAPNEFALRNLPGNAQNSAPDYSAYERNSDRIDAIRAQARQPRQNYELVSDEDPDRVIHRMNNATADEVRAWIAQQEQGGMPPGFLRTRIVAESLRSSIAQAIVQVEENFADKKVKGKSRPGRVKRAGASCKGSVTDLRARAKKYGGEKGRMYHWCANMKSGKKK